MKRSNTVNVSQCTDKNIMFPVVLYGCDKWSHMFTEEHRKHIGGV
jgi:hypothetical protein